MDKRDRNPSFRPAMIDKRVKANGPAPGGANQHVDYHGGYIQPGKQTKAYGGWNKYEGGGGKDVTGGPLKGRAATYKTRNQQMGGGGSHG
jgi:hypothetical protein